MQTLVTHTAAVTAGALEALNYSDHKQPHVLYLSTDLACILLLFKLLYYSITHNLEVKIVTALQRVNLLCSLGLFDIIQYI